MTHVECKKRIAIIPARGGSKRILRKNIREFCGKPILLYALEAVRLSGLFNEIHISTEDREIFDVAKKAGYEPRFMRDEALSDDFSTISNVLKSVIYSYQKINMHFDTVALVYPTAVFLDENVLVDAIAEIESSGSPYQELISVRKYSVPIEWAMHMDEGGMLTPVDQKSLLMRSQDIIPAWHETADFVLYTEKAITSDDATIVKRGYELPYITVDIDNESDWKLAETLFLMKFMHNKC